MEAEPPGDGPVSPDFTGIDPELMDRFIGELEHARDVLDENVEMIRRILIDNGVSALALGPIAEAGQWIGEELPRLRRRADLGHGIAYLPSWTPGGASGLVGYDENKVVPSEDMRRAGRALGERYDRIDPDPFLGIDPGREDRFRQIIDELAAHADDPDFTAAFFAALGTERILDLPDQLGDALQTGREEAIDTVARAFASAIGGGMAVPGFAAIAEAATTDRRFVPMLGTRRFPAMWLAELAMSQALGPHATASGHQLTPYLNALAANPAAARLVLQLATQDSPKPPQLLAYLGTSGQGDSRPTLSAYLAALAARTAAFPDSADAFGRMLASAAGAYDETDGHHSPEAAHIAFTIMTTLPDAHFGDATRVHLAEIAGSYAAEITQGADLGDADQLQPSAFTPVTSRIPGLTAAFRLSPSDTYRFIATFATGAATMRPFHNAMGALTQRLVDQAVPDMLESGDATRLDDLFAAVGNVNGFELAAQEKAAQAADAKVEAVGNVGSFVIGTAFTLAGYGIASEAGGKLWDLLSTAYSGWDTFKPSKSQTDKLRAAADLETLGRQYAIAQSLMHAGFPAKISPSAYQATRPPGFSLTDANGNLRPFKDFANAGEPGLRALDGWFVANGVGMDHTSLGALAHDLASSFDGHKDQSRVRAPFYPD